MRLNTSTSTIQIFALATLFTFVAATWVALGEPANYVTQPISIELNTSTLRLISSNY